MDELEKSRTRWRRWLGNKTRRDGTYWTTLLDATWLGWVDYVCGECDLEYRPLGLLADRETIKRVWLTAINHADFGMLRKLDRIYAAEKLGL